MPEWLTLAEARTLVMETTGENAAAAEVAIARALGDGSVSSRGRGRSYTGDDYRAPLHDAAWFNAEIRWNENEFSIPSSSSRTPHVITDVGIETDSLREWLATAEPPHSDKTRTGRRPVHDWDKFWAELACKLAEDDFPSPLHDAAWRNQADLERYMTQWFEASEGRSPTESEIRKKISKLLKHRETRGR